MITGIDAREDSDDEDGLEHQPHHTTSHRLLSPETPRTPRLNPATNYANTTCWTARDELLLLRKLQLEKDSNGPWPLAAAHSAMDHLQSRPLDRAMELGFCSVGVTAMLVDNTLYLNGTQQELKHIYLDKLVELSNKDKPILPHAARLGTCQQFTLSIAFPQGTNLIFAWRELERLLQASAKEYLQVLIQAELGRDSGLFQAMLQQSENRVCGIDLLLASGNEDEDMDIDNTLWSVVQRFTMVERNEGAILGQLRKDLLKLAPLARAMNRPLRAVLGSSTTPAKRDTRWKNLLFAGATMLTSTTDDLSTLEQFLRS